MSSVVVNELNDGSERGDLAKVHCHGDKIDSKLTNLFHRRNRATMNAGKETWTTLLSSVPALAD